MVDKPIQPSQPKIQEPRSPVVWTPEDAANFISAAIRESQRPLAEALRRQGVPNWVFGLVVLVMLAGSVFIWLHLDQQVNQAWQLNLRQAEEARRSSEEIMGLLRQREELAAALRERAAAAAADAAKANARLEAIRSQFELFEGRAEAARNEAEALRSSLAQERESGATRIRAIEADYEQLLLRSNRDSGSREALVQKLEEMRQDKRQAGERAEAAEHRLIEARKRLELLSLQVEGMREEREALRKQADSAQALLRAGEAERDTQAGERPPLPAWLRDVDTGAGEGREEDLGAADPGDDQDRVVGERDGSGPAQGE